MENLYPDLLFYHVPLSTQSPNKGISLEKKSSKTWHVFSSESYDQL